ncbi:hypothetical protein [Ruegeria sp. SCP11]
MTALYDTLSRRSKKVVLTLISFTTRPLLAYQADNSVFHVLEI